MDDPGLRRMEVLSVHRGGPRAAAVGMDHCRTGRQVPCRVAELPKDAERRYRLFGRGVRRRFGVPVHLGTAYLARFADEGMPIALALPAIHRTGSAAEGAYLLTAWMTPHVLTAPAYRKPGRPGAASAALLLGGARGLRGVDRRARVDGRPGALRSDPRGGPGRRQLWADRHRRALRAAAPRGGTTA